jgi:pimeloyl-ACP methyl ester carboxylesterase
MPPLDVQRLGSGPPVILVHGGLGRAHTWTRQAPLAQRWTLVVPARRGYPPNEPVERQDFELDAVDLREIAEGEGGAHLVGFSYGGLAASLVAERHPGLVRSLTLIEVPLWCAAPDDPEVQELVQLSERFRADPTNADDDDRRRFLGLAGLDPARVGDRLPDLQAEMSRARDHRSSTEADLDFEAIRTAAIATLVVSGGHDPGLERLGDVQAARLGAERAVLPGAGHAVPRARGFNERLDEFLSGVESAAA